MRSHPLYISTSYPLITTAYSLYLYHHSHYTCVSHPRFPLYHTLCIHDIAPTICITSDTLYKVSHPQFMTSDHIIYDITCTVFMSSFPQYLTLHPLYLCPHNPSTYDLWTTVCMTTHPIYIWHICKIHNFISTLWVHTIVETTLHPLHSWHHTHYIRHHTHDNTKVISAISPSISDTTSTVSVSSNPVYQLHYTHSLYDITHYMYDITFTMHDITWTFYNITPVYVWYHTQYIYDIIFSVYDITHTISLKQNNYTWHLTHSVWHHSHCICVATRTLSMPSQQLWKSSYLAHIWHHTHPKSHQIQTLWPQL